MTLKEIETRKNSNILDVTVKNYTECGYCSDPENKIQLNVPWEIYSTWLYLSDQVGDKEWAGVFAVRDGVVADFKIPEQEIASASVEFKEEIGGNGIVHSHHNMGAFHSSEDDKHCRNVYEYSIVLSNSKGYVASKRVEVPCGAFAYLNVELVITGMPADIDLSKMTEKQHLKEDTNKDQQSGLYPDIPWPDDYSFEDTPCIECATHDCTHCEYDRAEDWRLM